MLSNEDHQQIREDVALLPKIATQNRLDLAAEGEPIVHWVLLSVNPEMTRQEESGRIELKLTVPEARILRRQLDQAITQHEGLKGRL